MKKEGGINDIEINTSSIATWKIFVKRERVDKEKSLKLRKSQEFGCDFFLIHQKEIVAGFMMKRRENC